MPLYPTYDVDQSTASVYICGIVLWLEIYHDIALWYNYRLVGYKPVNIPQAGYIALVRNHIQPSGFALASAVCA